MLICYGRMCKKSPTKQIQDGKLVVWGPMVWDSNEVPLRIPTPFKKEDPSQKHQPVAEICTNL